MPGSEAEMGCKEGWMFGISMVHEVVRKAKSFQDQGCWALGKLDSWVPQITYTLCLT
jgi:hypothetical protein